VYSRPDPIITAHEQTLDTFKEVHWEQSPTVFKATAERKALFRGLFDIDSLRSLAKERYEAAEAAAEVCACACSGDILSFAGCLL
jgi:hypothetical protein